MDVYAYTAFPYDRSDDLSKQVYAQQALAPVPLNVESEAHAMPTPSQSGSPWNAHGLPWGLPSPPHLVQFTGVTPVQEVHRFSPVVHSKRKSLDVEPVIPAKQLITEEKMAAHLNGLHISSDYTSHSEGMDTSADTSFNDLSKKLKGHKLVLSEEIKRLKEQPLIPAALIERLEKPCMSLVVWKPKENFVEKNLKEVEEQEESSQKVDIETEEPTRRHGVLVMDNMMGMDIEM